jgi:hypothetical protein
MELDPILDKNYRNIIFGTVNYKAPSIQQQKNEKNKKRYILNVF